MNADEMLQRICEYLATYGLKIIAAIAIVIIGRWVAKLLSRLVRKWLVRADVDKTLVRFGESLCYIALLTKDHYSERQGHR